MPALLTPLAQFTVMSIAATLAFVPLAGAEISAGGVPPLHERTLPWIAALGPVDIYFSHTMAPAKHSMAANDTAVFS